MKSILKAVASIALIAGIATSAQAATRVGVLRCHVSGGASFIVGSSHDVSCVFSGNGRRERYHGHVNRYGLDIGYTGPATIVWGVFAPSDYRGHALKGSYVGASADASIGVGLGAAVLIGGNNRTISLQPFSVKSETGVDLGLGVGELQLY